MRKQTLSDNEDTPDFARGQRGQSILQEESNIPRPSDEVKSGNTFKWFQTAPPYKSFDTNMQQPGQNARAFSDKSSNNNATRSTDAIISENTASRQRNSVTQKTSVTRPTINGSSEINAIHSTKGIFSTNNITHPMNGDSLKKGPLGPPFMRNTWMSNEFTDQNASDNAKHDEEMLDHRSRDRTEVGRKPKRTNNRPGQTSNSRSIQPTTNNTTERKGTRDTIETGPTILEASVRPKQHDLSLPRSQGTHGSSAHSMVDSDMENNTHLYPETSNAQQTQISKNNPGRPDKGKRSSGGLRHEQETENTPIYPSQLEYRPSTAANTPRLGPRNTGILEPQGNHVSSDDRGTPLYPASSAARRRKDSARRSLLEMSLTQKSVRHLANESVPHTINRHGALASTPRRQGDISRADATSSSMSLQRLGTKNSFVLPPIETQHNNDFTRSKKK